MVAFFVVYENNKICDEVGANCRIRNWIYIPFVLMYFWVFQVFVVSKLINYVDSLPLYHLKITIRYIIFMSTER